MSGVVCYSGGVYVEDGEGVYVRKLVTTVQTPTTPFVCTDAPLERPRKAIPYALVQGHEARVRGSQAVEVSERAVAVAVDAPSKLSVYP